ncbi:MAG: carboxyl transferase domain-containing protein [Acidimicrobiales bacterium]
MTDTTTVDIRARAAGFVRASASDFHGRRVIVVDAQGEELAGALSPSDGHTIAAAARYALEQRLPLIIRLASSGANLEMGVGALDGWGGAAREMTRCSGIVPMIIIVTGPTVSGPALMLGLADVVVMVEGAYAFVSGPTMVEQFTGVPIDTDELGGANIHGRTSGVATMIAADVDEAEALARDILAFLPDHTDEAAPRHLCVDPVDRPTPEAYEILPESTNGSYDCRDILSSIVDDGYLLELHAGWAGNLVTCFASIGGRSIGIVANQPQTIAGTLDITASRKGARFVAMCDAFNLPILTLVDTSGFYPGKDLEWRGMIRYGAQMAFAYARASVPRVNVTTRKSYGGAYIVMDSKKMGNDMALAWPSAEIAVMGAKGAVEILHRRSTPEERADLEAGYEERLLNPYIAAERGTIDAVIDPADTRRQVAAAFDMLAGKRERLPRRRHDNTPL